MSIPGTSFDLNCTLCPRLAEFLAEGKRQNPQYHCAPVPPFGDPAARLLIVGLAPGFHGANATGRPFTGDYAGILLYETLFEFGLSTGPASVSADDNLRLVDCRISNSVKCVPPGNKPLPVEIATCNRYLANELGTVRRRHRPARPGRHRARRGVARVGPEAGRLKFAHGAEHALPRGMTLIDSYHCSRYNTNTRRLTTAMFRTVVGRAAQLARQDAP